MNCLRCNAENSEEAKFCKNCGMDMAFLPAPKNDGLKQGVLFLLIVLGWHYVISILYHFLNFYIRKLVANGNTSKIGDIYKVVGWFDSGTIILLMLILAIIAKNNTVRIFLIILVLLRMAMTFSYLLMT